MIKNNLQQIRLKDFGVDTRIDFANFLNVNAKTYSCWEAGVSCPKLFEAIRIAKKLNKKVEEIWISEE